MEAQEMLEKLLSEIEQAKLIKDFKNDNSHHITNIIAYYNMLKNGFSNSTHLQSATDSLLSLNGINPALSNLVNTLLKKQESIKQEVQINKSKEKTTKPPRNEIVELIRAINSTMNEHKALTKNGMNDTHECEQYIYLLRSYQQSLGKHTKYIPADIMSKMNLRIENEIQDATNVIEYANSIDSGFTL